MVKNPGRPAGYIYLDVSVLVHYCIALYYSIY